ncbi:MAG: ABC transporter permease [Planctomycetes bacterium]|nr:ABC transporter permease [Planctomycetota bacterium]
MTLLPFGYVLRNILRQSTRSLVTIGGIAATTMLVIAMQSFAAGMTEAGKGSARDDVVLLLGVSSEVDLVRSVVPRGSAEVAAASVPGVLTANGQRAASVELHIASRRGDQVGLLRGVTPAAYLVHTRVTVVEGREPREPFELMVGGLAATRMGLPADAMQVGKSIELERREFKIVGRFAAPGTVYEAEMWGRLSDIMLATKREDVSCVVLRLADKQNLAEVKLFAGRRLDLEIAAIPETEMMQALASSLEPIAALARWMAVLAVIAGAFACANTMFAAVLARTRELATLRSIGYSPPSLAVSIVMEGVFVTFAGGAIGILLALLVGNVSLRYPMGALRLDPDLPSRLVGMLAALASGLLGGIVPAVRAVRIPLVEAIGGRS